MNGIGKVGGYKIRLNRPLCSVPKKFTFAVARAYQNTAGSGAMGKFDVTVTIPDDEGAVQIDGMLAGRTFQHSGLRLTALAGIDGGVRAIVYGVEMRPGSFELLGHEFMNGVNERFRKVAAANARLICHDNHRQTGLVQATDGIRDTRQDTKSADMIQVADFFANGAVAIEKNRGAEWAGFRQDAPPSTKSTVARPLRRRRG